MLFTIAAFEFSQRIRRISTWIYFLVLAALGWLFTLMSGGAIPGASVDFGTGGKVLVNSPYALNNIITYISFFGVMITAAIAGQATYQDIDSNTADFFYTAPITKFQYLGGRFLGALAIQLLIFSSVGLGAWIGTKMPWLDPVRLGTQSFTFYLQPYAIMVLPNLIFLSAIFFALAALGRKMLPVYAGSVLLLIGYFVANQLSTNLIVNFRAALLDPFGSNAVDRITQYWSPFQRNTQLIPLGGILLANRALWLALGTIALIFTYAKFSMSSASQSARRKKGAFPDAPLAPPLTLAPPLSHPLFSAAASFRQFFSLTRIQFTETVRNVFFVVLLFAGWLFAAFSANQINNPFSMPTYPVTYIMLEAATGGFFVIALAIITFSAGELVWRERQAGVAQIVDALPVQRWVLFASKLAALMLIQILLVLAILAAGLTVQILHGYYRFQFGLYFTDLFGIRLFQFWFLCVLALFIHAIVDNKYLGHFVMVLYFIATIALPAAGFQDYLYRFGQGPPYIYSAMNGYGPFAASNFWFLLYWSIASMALAIVTNLFWVRGTESGWRVRWQLLAARFRGLSIAGLAACALLFAAVGGFIFYNTHVLNPFRTTWQIEEARAQYEKKYAKYKGMPQPRVTDVNAGTDLDPGQRVVLLHGAMTLENKTAAPMDRVAITVWPVDIDALPRPHIEIQKMDFAGGQTTILRDDAEGFYIYKLPSPLPPHGRITFDYALKYQNIGFVNSNPNLDIVRNGTFLNDRYAPFVGYAPDIELLEDSARHKHGLPAVKRMAKLEDVAARKDNMISIMADWINYQGTVSTSPAQIAILPGYLQKEWLENGRRFFQYKMDAPIMPIESMNSARYAVRRDRWRDVNLEIYYQPGDDFNLGRMMESMKASLEYFSANFSPFQFHQERIIEFPRYGTFAESFPNTIPYSESIGFIAYVDPRKPDAVDIPFYVTSHEVAHQWWGHQVISANVEGTTSIVETLAQYSALMVMKNHYGPESMRKFLRFEMENYLRGRGQERNEEEPLARADVNQGYIHYGKGAVVMYALQDYIGEANVNKALAEFIKAYAFKGPPYPTSLDLIACLKKFTPPEYLYLYDDMWFNITLYDNRARSASYVQLPDGKFQVTLSLEAKKSRADGKGQEHSLPLHDWIDVGILDSNGKFLYLQKHKFDAEQTQLTITVDQKPAQAGIDPLNKLIDRNPDDNSIKVEKE